MSRRSCRLRDKIAQQCLRPNPKHEAEVSKRWVVASDIASAANNIVPTRMSVTRRPFIKGSTPAVCSVPAGARFMRRLDRARAQAKELLQPMGVK